MLIYTMGIFVGTIDISISDYLTNCFQSNNMNVAVFYFSFLVS